MNKILTNMHYIITVIIIAGQPLSGESAKILGFFPVYSKSHHSINQPIMKGLAARGHNVTIISHFKSDSMTENYTEILLDQNLRSFVDSIPIEETGNLVGLWQYIKVVDESESAMCDRLFTSKYIASLINSEEKIDLFFAEGYHKQCYQLLAYKLNIPLILVSPPSVIFGVDYFVGNPNHPAYLPIVTSPFSTKMNFLQRLQNSFQYMVLYWHHVYFFNKEMKQLANQYLHMELPSDEELNKKTALVFYNNHFSFIPRPKSPNVIDVGGIHINEAKKLPQDIDEFITTAPHGVILFSFGTTIKASSLPHHKLEIIKEVFSSIPQRILWRVDEFNFSDLPSNVKLSKWLPQRDILEHKNVIAFISHCGLFGTFEAIHTATPVIGIPFLFDQYQDAKILAENGAGIIVDFDTMDKTTLLDAINKIIFNKTYHQNMRKLSKIFKDRPIKPIDEAIYWSEYILRHRGASHLRTQAADMPLYQYLLLDLFVVAVASIIALLYIFAYTFKMIILFICPYKSTKQKIS